MSKVKPFLAALSIASALMFMVGVVGGSNAFFLVAASVAVGISIL